MASIITAGTTTGTALSLTSDTSGELQIKTNNGSTTALTLTTGGAATFIAGTVSAPAITTSGDTNTGIFFPAADTIAFAEGGVESMRIDTSGNVGIGTSSPLARLSVGAGSLSDANIPVQINAPTGDIYYGANKNGGYGALFGYSTTGSLALIKTVNAEPIAFYTANTQERMRISSSGNLLVGTTDDATGSKLYIVHPNSNESLSIRNSDSATGRRWRCTVDNNNTYYVINQDTTGVYIANGGTSWLSLSDERHKDIIEPITNAVEKVSSLRTVIGKYKTDEEGTRRSFLIAQDVQAVLPEAVFSADPEKLGLSYTDTIPLLVAAIQELKAEVDSLKAQLENK